MKSLIGSAFLCALMAFSTASFGEDAKKDGAKAAAPINKKCPVEGGDVDPSVTVEHDGKTIGFCCAGCDAEFKKDTAKFMAIVDKEVAKDAPAKDAPAKDGKKDDKKKEAKLNTVCPVSGDDADKSITTDYKGRKVAFCCEDCLKDFEKNPAKYAAKLEEKKAAKKDDHADHEHKEGEEHKEGDDKPAAEKPAAK